MLGVSGRYKGMRQISRMEMVVHHHAQPKEERPGCVKRDRRRWKQRNEETEKRSEGGGKRSGETAPRVRKDGVGSRPAAEWSERCGD